MIKADVNVTGTIKRSALVRTDKSGKPYIGFVLMVNIQAPDNESKEVDIYVNIPNGQQSELVQYTEGTRITVNGIMDVHKKDENLVFFLEANLLTTEGVGELDAISGSMTFRGHLRNENVYDEKKTKNGRPFLRFSAYSAEKDGDNFVSTWVNFIQFPEKDADIESIKINCLVPKAHVVIKGDFKLETYKDQLRITSLAKEISLYTPDGQK